MSILKKFFQKPVEEKKTFPFRIDHEQKSDIPFVNDLSDEDLQELNSILDWNCFVLDKNSRRFGNIARSGKRTDPQQIPDYRHAILQKYIDLKNKHVLEIGCFEGIHTVSLCNLSKSVTAIDSRMENIVKTIVRTSLFGYKPVVFKSDVENWMQQKELLKNDVCHHIGVLYHLKDPVKHLNELCSFTNDAIFLDTHYANEEEATEKYTVDGKEYSYKKYNEGTDVFSGMYDHAKWLTMKGLENVLKSNGFNKVEVIEKRNERNGPRLLLIALRN